MASLRELQMAGIDMAWAYLDDAEAASKLWMDSEDDIDATREEARYKWEAYCAFRTSELVPREHGADQTVTARLTWLDEHARIVWFGVPPSYPSLYGCAIGCGCDDED
jgi:hypothetical protein